MFRTWRAADKPSAPHLCGRPSWVTLPALNTGRLVGWRLLCQVSSSSLVAQLIKNPHAMWETWVRSLGWEDLLEKRKATPSSILAWRIPWTVKSRT